MARRLIVAVFLSALALQGCAGQSAIEPIHADEIAAVLGTVKQQVSQYEYQAHALAIGEKFNNGNPIKVTPTVCGRGNIAYNIKSVSLDLTTDNTSTTSGGVSATVPISAFTLGLSDSFSLANENTQELKYKLYPLNRTLTAHDIDTHAKIQPIAAVLLNLRDASIDAGSVQGDCFLDYDAQSPNGKKDSDKDKSDSNTYQIGLKITRDNNAGVTVGISAVDVKLGVENKGVTGNTLTVTFEQTLPKRKPGAAGMQRHVGVQAAAGANPPAIEKTFPNFAHIPHFCDLGCASAKMPAGTLPVLPKELFPSP